MKRINTLFFIIFYSAFLTGCGGLFGGARTPAPVESVDVGATGANRARAEVTSRPQVAEHKPDNCCQKPRANVSIQEERIPKKELEADPRSPDAIFMALASLGIDYRWGGQSPATGFDCSGLVAYVYRDAYGMNIPAHTEAQARLGKPVDLAQLETGDLVFYNTLGKPNTHVGIYIGDERFIHAPRTGAAVRIENMRNNYWRTRFSGARRITPQS